MENNNILGKIFDDGIQNKAQNPTFEVMLKYQKKHCEMLKDYGEQIAFLEKLFHDCREEQKNFFMEDIPKIREKLTAENIDKSVQIEWIARLEKSMANSFEESNKLLSAFAVQKEHEFNEALKEKLEKL